MNTEKLPVQSAVQKLNVSDNFQPKFIKKYETGLMNEKLDSDPIALIDYSILHHICCYYTPFHSL